MKTKLLFTFVFAMMVFVLYSTPNFVFAYAICGDYHMESFPYYTSKRTDPSRPAGYIYNEMTAWPDGTNSEKFCEIGQPQPSIPAFPGAGEDTQWECVGNTRTVSCFAHRAPYPDFVPPGSDSTCLNIAGYCGNLHGRVFSHEQTDWPSQGYACAQTGVEDSAQHLLFYPDGPVLPFNWGSRTLPTDTGSGGRGGYRNVYSSHGSWLSTVLNNPPYNFHTQPSDFPEPGERIEWRCTRTWGWWTYGMNIHPRGYYIDCWAERREPPDTPKCGPAEGNFNCGPETQNWGSADNMCSQGYVLHVPLFPSPGSEAQWECVNYEDETDTILCGATRDPLPECGNYNQLFRYDTENWPSGDYCDIGEPSSEPDFPGNYGEEVSWGCTYSGCSVDCSAILDYPTPWISTRGGLVHAGGDIDVIVHDVLYSSLNLSTINFDESEELSLSTELLTAGSTFSGLRKYFYDLESYRKNLNRDWYQYMLSRANVHYPEEGIAWEVVEPLSEASSTISLSSTRLERCENEQFVYFINGDLEVKPEDYANLGHLDDVNGCVFIVSGNINIGLGEEFKSVEGEAPAYDLIRGYFISNGTISIENEGEEVNDGLKIIGGLFATGSPQSIEIERRLAPENNINYPVLIAFHDARYISIATNILGETFGGPYIRDIGFKE